MWRDFNLRGYYGQTDDDAGMSTTPGELNMPGQAYSSEYVPNLTRTWAGTSN